MKRSIKSDRVRATLLNLSPWILAVACTLLFVLLSVFAIQNYQREKALVLEGLGDKALTLIRFIDSSVRMSIRQEFRSSTGSVRWDEEMQSAMEQAAEQPGVDYVLLADFSGGIIAGAGTELVSETVDTQTLKLIQSELANNQNRFMFRVVTLSNSREKRVQIAFRYIFQGMPGHNPDSFRRGRKMRQFAHHPNYNQFEERMTQLQSSKPVYIVQLDFSQFNSPLQSQILQIVILLIVLLLVATGGALSFLTLRGLKGSQIRLGQITAFADILVSSLPIGLVATNSDGAIQVYNNAAKDILEIEINEALGTQSTDRLPSQLSQLFSGAVRIGEGVQHNEKTIECCSGKVKSLQLASVVVYDEIGEFGGEVLLIQDSTEITILERELKRSERLASLGKMAAGVAHELRNPLSSIKGLAVLLKSKFATDSKEADTAELLVGEVERLNRSISELLDYAKPASLDMVALDIGDILQKTVSLVRGDAESYNIIITLALPEGVPQVKVDKDKINQVFLNLLLNAVQAMPDGGKLCVSTAWQDSWVVVTVKDNGIGIQEENMQRVVDPYFTTKNNGTGLGLSLSTKFVEEHGGQLTIESSLGEFTKVIVRIPSV